MSHPPDSANSVDVSDLFERYRECSRHVWNTAFRDLPDGWHEFIDVDDALFAGIVLMQIAEDHDWKNERTVHGCYPSLRVQLHVSHSEIPIYWAREKWKSGTQNWQWQEWRLTTTGIAFGFIEFFDWCGNDGFRDAQYARTRVLASKEHPDLIGADVLVEHWRATFHFARQLV